MACKITIEDNPIPEEKRLKVENGDVLAYVHANDEKLGNEIAKDVLNAYTITNEIVSKKQDILKIV